MSEKEIAYPICPISLYFEGDEHICNTKNCDWDIDLRYCTKLCEIKGVKK